MLKISKTFVLLLLLALPVAAGNEKLDYARILLAGCSVDGLDGKAWRAYVWADYQNGAQKHDFALWMSERSNRWKALKDCDEWLTTTGKKQAEARKRNSQSTGESNRRNQKEGK